MPALIDRLFSKAQVEAIQKLWADKDSRSLLEQEIGKKLLDTKEFIDEFSLTQLMFITSLSSFASSPDECYDIAGIIYWGINRTDIIPLVTEHNNKELAYRCLISLGFFRGILSERCKRYGAPSPAFYRKIGIQSFEIIGQEDIGKHFYQWENFMGEIFI
jgi:hypothetical protein